MNFGSGIRRSVAAVSAIAMALALAGGVQSAYAQQVYEFDVPRGDLSTVITRIARTAGTPIAFPAGLTASRSAGPIRSRGSVRDALAQALAGTGLQVVPGASGSLTIKPAGAAGAQGPLPVGDLDAIDVTDAGTGPYRDQGFQAGDAGLTARLDAPAKEIPITVNAVTSEVIRSQNLTTATDAVENVAGVVIAGSNDQGKPGVPGFTIRGFSGQGYRVNGTNDSGFSTIPIDDVERVEVLKGPTGIIGGTSNPGGLVNIATKEPVDREIRELTLRHGTYAYSTAAIDLGGRILETQGLNYRLNMSGNIADRNYAGYGPTNEILVSPSVKWTGENTSVLTGLRYINQRQAPSLYTVIPNRYSDGATISRVSRDAGLINDRFFADVESFSVYSKISHNLGTFAGLDLTLNNHLNHSWETSRSIAPFFVDAAQYFEGPGILAQQYSRRDSTIGLNNRLDLTGTYDAGFAKQTLKVGYDFERYQSKGFQRTSYSTRQLIPSMDLVGRQPLFRTDDLPLAFAPDTTVQGVYFIDKIDVLDNRLHILGMVRQDWYKQAVLGPNYTYNPVDDSFTLNYAIDRNSGSALSWTAGAAFDVTDWLTVYGSRNTGFRVNPVGPSGVLPPRFSDQAEAGLRTFWFDKRLTVSAAFFDIALTNVAVPDPFDPLRRRYILVDGQKNRGYEVEAQGEILPGLNLIASYGFVNAAYSGRVQNGAPASGIPKNTFSTWLTYTLQDSPYAGLTFGFGSRSVTSSIINEFTGEYFKIPGYTIFNAMIGFEKGDYSVNLKINNLTNEYYYQPSYSGDYIGVGQGRSAMLTAKMKF